MLGGIRWHLVSVTHPTKLKWLVLCNEEQGVNKIKMFRPLAPQPSQLSLSFHAETQTTDSDLDTLSVTPSLGNRGDELTPCYCSSLQCLQPLQHELIRELQRVIISRVNPRCSTLTSRMQRTEVINYPLCSNRNSFMASYWLEKPHFSPLSAYQRATLINRVEFHRKIWGWKLTETNWIILDFTIEIKVADNNTTYFIHGVSPASLAIGHQLGFLLRAFIHS